MREIGNGGFTLCRNFGCPLCSKMFFIGHAITILTGFRHLSKFVALEAPKINFFDKFTMLVQSQSFSSC